MSGDYVHTFKISEVVKGTTMNIRLTGVRMFSVRCTIAVWLIRLAAFVLPLPCDVVVSDEDAV